MKSPTTDMKRFVILSVLAVIYVAAFAARYEYKFNNTPIAQALAKLVKDNPSAKITFIYNEMDDYSTSATISTDDLKAAVKAIVARNPISVSEKKGRILVEALQRGKYRYSGKLVNEYNEPVGFATVLLLNPKDSVAITFGITDKDGNFLIPCDRMPVLAKISSTGYETKIMNFSCSSIGTIRFKTKPIQLQNIDIVSDIVQMESDKTVFVPLQRQKNTSTSGIDLLEQMGIPQLMVIDGKPQTISGKQVALFIDYMPASDDDLTGMNLQDVKRVEFLESPSDPRFLGEKYVVNFIMEKYVYGGYVKLNGYSCLISNDQYINVNTRYQYKSMTYDLAGFAQHYDLYHYGSATNEVFRFPSAEGKTNTIERYSGISNSRRREGIGRLSLKATYSSANIIARSTLSGGISDCPSNYQEGEVVYSPEVFPTSSYSTESSSKTKYFRFNGSYFFSLPRDFSISFTPTFNYSYTDQNSIYDEKSFAPIVNGAVDHTSTLSGYLNLNRNLGKAGSVRAYMSGKYDLYRTRYSGSFVQYDRSRDQRYTAGVAYSVKAGGFYGDADFGWIWNKNIFNEFESHSTLPSADLSLAYMINKSHRFNLSFGYSSWAPNVSFKSQAVIQSNHLMSYTGNPDLKPCSHISADLGYNWVPSKNGYVSFSGSLWKVLNRFVYDYEPVGDKMIRYIRQPMGEYHLIRFGTSGSLYLFGRKLMLRASLTERIARNGKPYNYTHFDLNYDLRATYYLKDFYFSGYYSNPTSYSDGFMVGDLYEDKSYYYFLAGWANKNWNIRFTASNFARWSWMGHSQKFTSSFYDRSFKSFDRSRHADLNIVATYTFNYGKKQRDVEELNTSNSSSSGILRN